MFQDFPGYQHICNKYNDYKDKNVEYQDEIDAPGDW